MVKINRIVQSALLSKCFQFVSAGQLGNYFIKTFIIIDGNSYKLLSINSRKILLCVVNVLLCDTALNLSVLMMQLGIRASSTCPVNFDNVKVRNIIF